MALMSRIFEEPAWLVAWVTVLMVMNTLSVTFLARVEARWTLAAWLVNIPIMGFLFDTYGYQRILGLSHILVWTPLLIYLWLRRSLWNLSRLSGKWIAGLFAVDLTSLVIDYIDLGRYLMGERLA